MQPKIEEDPTQQQLDPSISSILAKDCPYGHSSSPMTIGEMYANPKLRGYVEDQINNIDVFTSMGIEREAAIGMSLGGIALKDEHGALIRAQVIDPEISQTAGMEKK